MSASSGWTLTLPAVAFCGMVAVLLRPSTMSVMAADSAPRFLVRGTKAAYVKYALDGQENVLLAGGRPQGPEWGREPEERWGHLVVEGQSQPVPSEHGNYGQLYADLASRTGHPAYSAAATVARARARGR